MNRRTFFRKSVGATIAVGAGLTLKYRDLFAAPHNVQDRTFDLAAVKGGGS